MKKYALIGLLTLLSHHSHATEQSINKDLDGDGKPNRVWVQNDDFHIKLSSQKPVIIEQNPCDEPPNLRAARVGFIISCDATWQKLPLRLQSCQQSNASDWLRFLGCGHRCQSRCR